MKTHDWLRTILVGCACAALVAVAILAMTLQNLAVQTQGTLDRVETQVYYQSLALMRTQNRLVDVLDRTADEVKYARLDLRDNTYYAISAFDARLRDTNIVLMRTSLALDYAVADTNHTLRMIAAPVGQVASQVSGQLEAVDDFMNCNVMEGGSADCLFNRYVGTMRAVEKSSMAVQVMAEELSVAVPRLTKELTATTETTGDLAKSIEKQTKWIGLEAIVGALHTTCQIAGWCR